MLQSYSHTLSHITNIFNYIVQVVKQQGSDNTEGSEFHTAVSDLGNIKSHFPSILIMCLTATATPAVEEDIKLCFETQLYKRCP